MSRSSTQKVPERFVLPARHGVPSRKESKFLRVCSRRTRTDRHVNKPTRRPPWFIPPPLQRLRQQRNEECSLTFPRCWRMRERAPAPPPGLLVCATAGSSINKIQIDGFSGNKAVFNLTCCYSISRCSSRMSVSRSGRRSLFWCDPHTMKKKLKKKKKDLQPVHQTNSFCKWPLRATTGCPVASVSRRTDVIDAGHWTQPQEHFVVWQFVLFLSFFFFR